MTFKHLIVASALALSAAPGAAQAAEQPKAGTETYLIVSPRTAEQRLAAQEALAIVSAVERPEAKSIAVGRFTAAQVAAPHGK
jgi:hypothetical protein